MICQTCPNSSSEAAIGYEPPLTAQPLRVFAYMLDAVSLPGSDLLRPLSVAWSGTAAETFKGVVPDLATTTIAVTAARMREALHVGNLYKLTGKDSVLTQPPSRFTREIAREDIVIA